MPYVLHTSSFLPHICDMLVLFFATSVRRCAGDNNIVARSAGSRVQRRALLVIEYSNTHWPTYPRVANY